MQQPHQQLPRCLTATHATAIVVGIIIGSGIFLVPREMMAAVGSARTVYIVWIAGGLLSLFGAMSYAELAAMKPRVGGEYAFLYDGYGPLPAFLYTWTWTLIAKPASIATIAAGLMRVLGTFSALSFLTHPAVGHLLWSQVLAIVATWLITLLNIVSTRESANVQTALTWLKVLMIIVIAGLCFTAIHAGSWHNFAGTFTGARGGFTGFMVALVAALWAYDGWSDVTQMAGEVKDPQRSLPLALVGGVAIVAALYMLTNAAIQYVLPAAAIAAADRPAADALRIVAGNLGAGLVSIGMAVSICATFVGSSLSGARVPFAAAQDRLFPPALAAIHPRFRTPWASLVLQGCSQHAAAASHRKIPGPLLARHFFGVALLRAHHSNRLHLPRTRATNAAPLPRHRLSGRPCTVCIGCRRAVGLQLHGPATQLDLWRHRHPVRNPRALCLSAPRHAS